MNGKDILVALAAWAVQAVEMAIKRWLQAGVGKRLLHGNDLWVLVLVTITGLLAGLVTWVVDRDKLGLTSVGNNWLRLDESEGSRGLAR